MEIDRKVWRLVDRAKNSSDLEAMPVVHRAITRAKDLKLETSPNQESGAFSNRLDPAPINMKGAP